VVGATPCPKMGWLDHPIFGQGVASDTPYRSYGGGRSHPRPLGVVRPPRKAKKKKKTKKMGLGFWGWPDHPLGPGGGFGHLHALGGGPATPKGQNPFFPFFFFLAFPDHPQRPGLGWLRPPPYDRYGVVRPPHFWARGGSSHPTISSSFFFLFFFLILISFFFSKKKKKKNLKFKTTPFCPKRRRFGRAQNGVVLE
jgi:hypothetical protein